MRRTARGFLQRAWSDTEGASALEFAIVAPVFFMLVFGVIAVIAAIAQINPIWAMGPYRPDQVVLSVALVAVGVVALVGGALLSGRLGQRWAGRRWLFVTHEWLASAIDLASHRLRS